MPLNQLNIQAIRDKLQALDFKALFNLMGWSRPNNPQPVSASVQGLRYTRSEIAQLAGVAILEIQVENNGGKIPDARQRRAIFDDIAPSYYENLLFFLDKARTQSLWYWMKREGGKKEPREHLYVKGQPGDLSLNKLEAMAFDMSVFEEEGAVSVLDVAKSLQNALDVERVTKRFFEDYKAKHDEFSKKIVGIDDERDRRWYASILLNRLMFTYFLQSKRLINNGQINYLQEKFQESRGARSDQSYRVFLNQLFFEGFAKPEEERSAEAKERLGHIRYLNGGMFCLIELNKSGPILVFPMKPLKVYLSCLGVIRGVWTILLVAKMMR